MKLKFLCENKNVGFDKIGGWNYVTHFKRWSLKVLIFLELTKNDYFSHQISKKLFGTGENDLPNLCGRKKDDMCQINLKKEDWKGGTC